MTSAASAKHASPFEPRECIAAPPFSQPNVTPTAAIDGLYIHVPFCFHKCHYCDFYSIVDGEKGDAPAREAAFVERLIGELRWRAEQADVQPRTIFVGGGTPTLLSVDSWRKLLAALRDVGAMRRVEEFTVEANPETVTAELMATLAVGGVNRVSLGAQSFAPDLLKTLERWHEPASVARAVRTVRDAGVTDINLDLIFAIPGQTMAQLDADLDVALELAPTHLSCYSLIYEPNTAMTQRLKQGAFQPMDEETERAMYARVIDRLAAAGFVHYEVSNWAKTRSAVRGPRSAVGGEKSAVGEQRSEVRDQKSEVGGRDQSEISDQESKIQSEIRNPKSEMHLCLHNLLYWHNANWLGVGPGAASHVDGWRWKNQPHLGRYLVAQGEPPTVDHEKLPREQSVGEQLMLRLRLIDGVDEDWLRENLPPDDERWVTLDELIAIGMLTRDGRRIRLTPDGLHIADTVIAKLL